MTPRARSGAPYPGLRAFRRDEANLFFGRDDCIDSMVDRLAAGRFLAVVGSSGSGKSSLAKTGLPDALEYGLLAKAGARWRIVDFKPGSSPLRNLAEGLLVSEQADASSGSSVEIVDIELLRAFLAHGPRALVDWCSSGHVPKGLNLLLLVDQFEELFRYESYAGREEAEAFVALLIESAQDPECSIYVALTMRSEYLGACALVDGLAEKINEGMFLMPRMTREQCREAITGPARKCGLGVEEALVNRVLNDLASFAPWDNGRSGGDQLDRIARRADQLPLLQYTLNRMWADATKNPCKTEPIVLGLKSYEQMGGLTGRINTDADKIVDEEFADARHRRAVERVFRALTNGTTAAEATRRPRSFAELVAICGEDSAAVRSVVDAFRAPEYNFLGPDSRQPLEAATFVDISHESLIRQWARLGSWLAKEAESARVWRRVADAAAMHREDKGDFLDGLELANIGDWWSREGPNAAWAARYGGDFDLAAEFLQQSKDAERQRLEADRERDAANLRRELRAHDAERHARRNLAAFAGATVLLTIAVGAVVYAIQQRKLAKDSLGVAIEAASTNARSVTKGLRDGRTTFDFAGDLLAPWHKAFPRLYRYWEKNVGEDLQATHHLFHLSDSLAEIDLAAGEAERADGFAKSETALAASLATFGLDSPDEIQEVNYELAKAEERAGDAARAMGKIEEATAHFLAFRDRMLAVADRRSSDEGWHQDLADAHERLGDMLQAQKRLAAAENEYRKMLPIAAEWLRQPHPDRQYWTWEHGVAHENIGDTRRARGDTQGALGEYREFQSTMDKLVSEDRNKTDSRADSLKWQRSQALSHQRVGDMLRAKGDFEAADAEYREFLTIISRVAEQDSSSALARRLVAQAHERQGDLLLEREGPQAMEAAKNHYEDDRNIATELTDKDTKKKNGEFLRDLSISEEKIGDALFAHKDFSAALKQYRAYQSRARELALRNPGNYDWLRDLWISYERIGDTLLQQKSLSGAMAAFETCAGNSLKDSGLSWESGGNGNAIFDPRNGLPPGYQTYGEVLDVQGYCRGQSSKIAAEVETTANPVRPVHSQ